MITPADIRAAMTPIDIPNGCQLVVDNHPSQAMWWYPGYRRVVQVVEMK